MVVVKEIKQKSSKQAICNEILNSLPNWFGISQAINNYVEHVVDMPFWASYVEDSCVGFLAIKSTSKFTAEIHVMGVLNEYQNKGIGKHLFANAYAWCKEHEYSFLQVKTLDDTHPDEFYTLTRKFYRSIGFKDLESFDELWGKENRCLIMIMSIQ